MKRIILVAAALLTLSLTAASAQELLRSHFSFNGYNYISAELEKVPCDHPFYIRLERVGFPDNTYAYLMHINYEDKNSYEIPRGTKMAFTTPDSSDSLVLFPIGSTSAGKSSTYNNGNFAVKLCNASNFILNPGIIAPPR